MKFIHAADLHIDSPLRGLSNYPGAPAESIRSATRRALDGLVELALSEQVGFVLLAGDIFDGDWPDFNTGLYFRSKMQEMAKNGIRVFIKKGNHDAESQVSKELPAVEGVHVFSTTKAETIQVAAGDDVVAIHGQSYAMRDTMTNLVPNYPAAIAGAFNIGVLHTCLDGSEDHSPYAPTSKAELVSKGYDYWALGHIHLRQVIREASPRIVFPGNIQGRHAKETGSKGCELVTITHGAITESRHVSLDVVRWHQAAVDAQTADSLDELAQAVREAIVAILSGDGEDSSKLNVLRIQIQGSPALASIDASQPGSIEQAVRAAASDLDSEHLWVEKVRMTTVHQLDRAAAADRNDAISELIGLVDELAGNPDRLKALLEAELAELKVLPSGLTDASTANLKPEEQMALLRAAEMSVLSMVANQGAGA